jgi:hypothetical protein
MRKQTCLDLKGDRLVLLWQRLPERARRATVEQFARLVARAAQAWSSQQGGRKP